MRRAWLTSRRITGSRPTIRRDKLTWLGDIKQNWSLAASWCIICIEYMHRCHCLQKFRNVAAFESTLNSTIVSYRVALKSVINVLFVRCQRVRLSACVGMCWNVGDSIMKACVNGKIELRYGLLTTDYSLSLSLSLSSTLMEWIRHWMRQRISRGGCLDRVACMLYGAYLLQQHIDIYLDQWRIYSQDIRLHLTGFTHCV